MKYMLMMNTPGKGPYQINKWPLADIKAHIAFMMSFNKKLTASGEWVDGQGLTPPLLRLVMPRVTEKAF